jgi:hypothetical protein
MSGADTWGARDAKPFGIWGAPNYSTNLTSRRCIQRRQPIATRTSDLPQSVDGTE